MVDAMFEMEMLNQLAGPLRGIGLPAGNVCGKDIPQDVQVGDQVELLEHKTNALGAEDAAPVGGKLVWIHTPDSNGSTRRPQQRTTHQQQRSFPRSARPSDGNRFMRFP